MKKYFCILMLIGCALLLAGAQKKNKPWTEWSSEQAWKILDSSAWVYSAPAKQTVDEQNQNYQDWVVLRLLSARPVRQAYACLLKRQYEKADPTLKDKLNVFVEADYSNRIVIAGVIEIRDNYITLGVNLGSPRSWWVDPYSYGQSGLWIDPDSIAQLKKDTYIVCDNGEKVYLENYIRPAKGTLGSQFVFPRAINGKSVVSADSKTLEFHTITNHVKRYAKFKLSSLMYEGKLEY